MAIGILRRNRQKPHSHSAPEAAPLREEAAHDEAVQIIRRQIVWLHLGPPVIVWMQRRRKVRVRRNTATQIYECAQRHKRMPTLRMARMSTRPARGGDV
jgi:hypothetical protein